MIRKFLTILLTIIQMFTFAGGLALIEDFEGKLFIFDKGKIQQLEHNKVKQKVVGENFAAYIDYLDNLKVWYNGRLTRVQNNSTELRGTDNLITWKVADFLYVWQDGQKKEISNDVSFVRPKGATIYFQDDYKNELRVYYDHEVYTIVQNNYDLKTNSLGVGRGSVIVQDANQLFYIFVNGIQYKKDYSVENLMFSAGKQGVLIRNEDSGELEYITADGVETIDYLTPKWFKTEYSWILWEEPSGSIQLKYGDDTEQITYQRPSELIFSPESVLFDDANQLFLFSNGEIKKVCHYIPARYDVYNQIFVYINQSKQVELVKPDGSTKLSSIPNVNYDLVYDVVVLYEENKRRVYYDGEFYSF